ncbi:G-protein coupled receptor 143-like [Oscarella lobularis]|uniref:G-protein coupled receptor 143-like n=1 Tax=Oscarella lobularis TaxID=121494 RepID=UPI003313BD92
MASAHFVSTSCLKTALNEAEAYIYASVDIVTATLGFFGSLYLILTWKAYYRIRLCDVSSSNKQFAVATNRTIVFFLAVSTLFACMGVLAKSIQLAMTYSADIRANLPVDEVEPRLSIPDIPISILGSFSYIATFMWTFCYALDIHFQLRGKRVSPRSYHVLCWGFAGILTLLQAVINHIPPFHYCKLPAERADAKYLAFYAILALIMIAVPVIFLLSLPKIRRLLIAQGRLTENERRVFRAIAWKFFFIVLIFIYGWIFNVINGIYFVAMKTTESPFIFYVLEACTNPMQGFFNAFVFGKHEVAQKWFCNSCASEDDDDDEENQRLARDYVVE